MLKKPQVWLIVAFIALMVWGLAAQAANGFESALSYGVVNTKNHITQRISYMHGDKWVVQYERHGGNGYEDTNSYSLQRQIVWRSEKKAQPYLRYGISYFDDPIRRLRSGEDSVLVDERLTYSLGLGLRFWGVMNMGIEHNSTAGRSDPNKGVDRVYLGIMLWL